MTTNGGTDRDRMSARATPHQRRSKVAAITAGVVIASLSIASAGGAAAPSSADADVSIGVAIFRFDNTYMTAVRDAMEDAAGADGGVSLDVVDSQDSQPTQNDQVDLFIAQGVDAMAINPVDRTSAATIIAKAEAADTPVVFFNREPLPEDLEASDQAYYVGAHAEESGTIQGQIVVDYWNANPDADRNGDGVIQYVMLTGEPGHQDAELRTEYSIKAITDAGLEVEAIAEDTAMWQRVQGQEKMAAFLAAHGDEIEVVLANNDDMALGAIEALRADGYFADERFMPVVGVDATAPALEALEDGTLLGTVLNDAVNQGAATLNLSAVLARGEAPTLENVGYEMEGQYIWIPYQAILIDNVADAG